MYSMAYEPRMARALAQEHIDRQVRTADAHATAHALRRSRRVEKDVIDAPVSSRPPLWVGLAELVRRRTTSGARLWARAH